MSFFKSNKKSFDPNPLHPVEQRLEELLVIEGFSASYNSEWKVFECHISGKQCQFVSIVFYNPDSESVTFRSYFPLEIMEVSKLRIAELFVRINHNLNFGALKLDFENGKSYFEISHVLHLSVLEEEVFHRLFIMNLRGADEVFCHVLNVNLGNDEPITAALKYLD